MKLRSGAEESLPQVHLVRRRVSTGFAAQAWAASNMPCLPSQETGKQGPKPGDPGSLLPGVRMLALPGSLRNRTRMCYTPMRVGFQVMGLLQPPCDFPLYPRGHLSPQEYCDMCILGPGQKSILSSLSLAAYIYLDPPEAWTETPQVRYAWGNRSPPSAL